MDFRHSWIQASTTFRVSSSFFLSLLFSPSLHGLHSLLLQTGQVPVMEEGDQLETITLQLPKKPLTASHLSRLL